ncbi:MAG TPA: carboxypeptidase-like regulatory domain-containing protein [Terriglobia bacterium]|nr:carboxypeptidase-like regulatory domain-containing protein [Terriglobia bacterium]
MRVVYTAVTFIALILQNGASGTLKGVVTDPSGALIPGATVQLRGPAGEQTQTTDANGQYTFTGVRNGTYDIQVSAPDFKTDQRQAVNINGATTLDVQLALQVQSQVVNVQEEAATVSLEPDANASATVLGKTELDSLSDDPDELAQQLQALAGPGAGPGGGGQIYTDGFSNGGVPPKSSIREIRINSNPYSAEYDSPGNNRVEILTKPGSDTIHGQFSTQFNNESFNTRSPLYTQSSSLPAYKNLFWNGNIAGPIKKNKASFTLDFVRRDITENAFILATNLNSSLAEQTVNKALLTPQTFTSVVPRVDLQINANHTLVLRYEDTRQSYDNLGVGGFRLPETAFNQQRASHSFYATETALLSPMLVNETRFQFSRYTNQNIVTGSSAAIWVQDAFTGGSATVGNSRNTTNRWEMTNMSVLNRGKHTLKWGARLRQSFNNDVSESNFNGTFTFFGGTGPALDANNQPIPGSSVQLTGLDVYQRTLRLQQQGFTPAQIRAAGGGASLFSMNAGTPLTRVTQFDLGSFFNDDWKIQPNFTLSYGLRYEMQTNIHDKADWSPRLGFAWGIDGKGTTPAKTVLRGGAGWFYNRIGDYATLNAIRYNGVTQQSFLLTNPDFFPTIPSPSALESSVQPQTVQLLSPTIQAPLLIFGNVGMDRQINKYFRVSLTYNQLRALHFIRTRDVNARLPGTNVFPYGDDIVRMQTESSGIANQRQFVINPSFNYKKVNFFGNYVLSYTEADFDGLAANPYNLHAEWARAFGDVRHRLTIGPTFPVPMKLLVNTLFIYNSGPVYNITTGLLDPSGDGSAVQRPALLDLPAASCTGADLRYVTQFGCFDLAPGPGTPTISRNYGRGPGNANMTVRVARTFDFGKGEAPAAAAVAAPNGAPAAAPAAPMKYHLTFSAYAINPLNHPNFATPVGNLTSPFFGKPLNLQGTFTPGNTTYNRKVTLQVQMTF